MKHTPSRTTVVVVAALAIMLGGVVSVTPAGAALQQQAGSAMKDNWHKIWKKQIKPRADKRYYKKSVSDDRYAAKGEAWTKGEADLRYYTRADSDAKYYSKADSDAKYYSRTESDAKYVQKSTVHRGVFLMGGPNAAGYQFDKIEYGVVLAAAPTAHYIKQGAAVPAGCSGTPAAPDADPGHLCVFESQLANMGATRTVTNLAFAPQTASPVGAFLYAATGGAGYGYAGGSWAMRPGGAAVVVNPAKAPSLGPTTGSLE